MHTYDVRMRVRVCTCTYTRTLMNERTDDTKQDVKKQEEDLERQLRAMMRGNNDIPDIWTVTPPPPLITDTATTS